MTLDTNTAPGTLALSTIFGVASGSVAWLWAAATESPWWMPLACALIAASVPMAGHLAAVYRTCHDRRLRQAQRARREAEVALDVERRRHRATRDELDRVQKTLPPSDGARD